MYFLSALQLTRTRNGYSTQQLGYFKRLPNLLKRIAKNSDEINFGGNRYLVVEKIGEGFYRQPTESHWFRFENGVWKRLEKAPDHFKGITKFAA